MSTTTRVSSPVLFLVFNRPEPTKRVFEAIRAARPPRLYIAADGPRMNRPNEKEACESARLAASQIDWSCEVKTLYRENNLGCKEAVSSAIDWFFQNEEEGIILEDDCLPAADFFPFCDTLLEKYRTDSRVRHICGCNFQFGTKRGDASYYFSRMTHIWGWASWRRAWQDYDKNLTKYTVDEIANGLEGIFSDELVVANWRRIANDLKLNKIDTWDYQLGLTNFLQNGLCIIPNQNLVTNIGFGEGATHTTDKKSRFAEIPSEGGLAITHPKHFVPNQAADFFTLNEEFHLDEQRRLAELQAKKRNRVKYRLKRWLARHGGPSRWEQAGS